ncbi:hypothetical protein LSAT2_006970 [Lamellibrachia satsuma]|nr:hypothetical protein LSAT2_006970 [Lamellibrachia satsuma]
MSNKVSLSTRDLSVSSKRRWRQRRTHRRRASVQTSVMLVHSQCSLVRRSWFDAVCLTLRGKTKLLGENRGGVKHHNYERRAT